MNHARLSVTLLCGVCLIASGMSGQQTKPTRVVVALNDNHQAQYAGLYMAKELGYYAKAGLDVDFVVGYYDSTIVRYLLEGRAQFAIMNLAMSIIKRDDGVPIVNVAQLFQRTAALLVARKDTSIRSVADLNGRKLGMQLNLFSDFRKAIVQDQGLTLNVVPVTNEVNRFLWGSVDCIFVYSFREHISILMSGVNEEELFVYSLYDHGANFPGDGICTLQKTQEMRPELCRSFVEASLEGWRFAFTHEQEAVESALRQARKSHNYSGRAQQRRALDALKTLYHFDSQPQQLGRLTKGIFDSTAQFLLKYDLIKRVPLFDVFYKGR